MRVQTGGLSVEVEVVEGFEVSSESGVGRAAIVSVKTSESVLKRIFADGPSVGDCGQRADPGVFGVVAFVRLAYQIGRRRNRANCTPRRVWLGSDGG